MGDRKQTVAAVVVTYNRIKLLKECIQSIRTQTRVPEEVIIVNNNSTDGTLEWLNEQKDLTVISQQNLGGAGGFYTGIKTAYEKGYDWVWCMDDDSQPFKSSLKIMLPATYHTGIAAICSSVYDADLHFVASHRGFFNFHKKLPLLLYHQISEELVNKCELIAIDFTSFVGILINQFAIKQIGFPKKEFFIHHDDIEYCIRLREFGKILLIPSSKIMHLESTFQLYQIKKRFMHKISYRIPYEKFWITLYSMRNYVWLTKKYIKPQRRAITAIIYDFFILSRGIILYDDLKFRRIKLLLFAFIDGYKGVFKNQQY